MQRGRPCPTGLMERTIAMLLEWRRRASTERRRADRGRREARLPLRVDSQLGEPQRSRRRKRAALTTDERQRMRELERDVRELKRANAILRRVSAFFAAELDRPRQRWSASSTRTGGAWGRSNLQAPAGGPELLLRRHARPPSASALRDALLTPVLVALWSANYRVYGARKLWRAARRAGDDVGRDPVARLMDRVEIEGAAKGQEAPHETRSRLPPGTPTRFGRRFVADRPQRLWVTDLT